MREDITIDVLTNWVSMMREAVDGALWLSDDDAEARFYEVIAHDSSRVVPANSIAIPLLNSVEQRGVHGVVAVISGVAAPSDAHNIFRPTRGDVATTLFIASHGEKVMRDICGTAWLGACEKEVGPVRKRILQLACNIQTIRTFCHRDKVPPPSELHAIILWDQFDIDWTQVSNIVRPESISELQATCHAERARDTQALVRRCNGADAIHLFASATQSYRPRGLMPTKQVDTETFLSMLRVAFEPGYLEGDDVFWKMKKWSRCHPKYPLLRRWRDLDSLGALWDQRYWKQDFLALLRGLDPGALLAVFKMDLDNFKVVNERCGHEVGDQAIKLYCKLVLEVLGAACEVYRRGGDEVVALGPGLTEGTARELAEKTRARIESEFARWATDHGLQSGPTASIGLTMAWSDSDSDEVIRRMDEAQKRAKEQGKNRVAVLL